MEIPKSWTELSDDALGYVCELLAMESYTVLELCAYVLLRCCMTAEEREMVLRLGADGEGDVVQYLADELEGLSWLGDLPRVPVRVGVLDGARAVSANLDGLSFGDYLRCENLFQGYLSSENKAALGEMLKLLYRGEDGGYGVDVGVTAGRCYGVLLWWVGVKQWLAVEYENLFVGGGDGVDDFGEEGDLKARLKSSMNAQIRALTDGDVTKEGDVLGIDVHRALTELSAKVRDAAALRAHSG